VTVETLTYVALAERLKNSPEAARSFAKRLGLHAHALMTGRHWSQLILMKYGTSPCPPDHRVVTSRSPE
jgi:hypothetical protein